MNDIGYYIRKIEQKFVPGGGTKKKEWMNDWFRKQGIALGEHCSIFCNIVSSEPYLIKIGNNVTVSNDVQLITHDNSIIKTSNGKLTDLFGRITIGDNCFIGAHAIILPGVNIADNIVVASGSVVTKSFEKKNIVIGGNPAKEICSWEQFMQRNEDRGFNVSGLSFEKKKALILGTEEKLKSR